MVRYQYIDSTIREKKIHPDELFKKENKLARKIVIHNVNDQAVTICPICGNERTEILFKKWGVPYALCLNDWSVSIASQLTPEIIKDYFHNSELADFRSIKDYQELVSKERQFIWESLITWIEGRVSRYLGHTRYHTLSWGAKFVGWIKMLENSNFTQSVETIDPLPPIEESECTQEEYDIIYLMDVLQRQNRPLDFLSEVRTKLSDKGIIILTCRSGSGFDILTLRNNSKSVFPFDHLFLPSPSGLKNLLNKSGFDVLEITTPGMLDVRYVYNSYNEIPKEQYFQRYFFSQAEEPDLERLQSFLQQNNLSSHIRCIAKKK